LIVPEVVMGHLADFEIEIEIDNIAEFCGVHGLDTIAEFHGIDRRIGETDDELRKRILSHHGWSGLTGVESTDDRYPHKCPHCGSQAYVGGDFTVDCSKCDGVM
jgi:hypothetical protein